jgi:hypothetical protein
MTTEYPDMNLKIGNATVAVTPEPGGRVDVERDIAIVSGGCNIPTDNAWWLSSNRNSDTAFADIVPSLASSFDRLMAKKAAIPPWLDTFDIASPGRLFGLCYIPCETGEVRQATIDAVARFRAFNDIPTSAPMAEFGPFPFGENGGPMWIVLGQVKP